MVGLERPTGPACEAGTAHGFIGRERQVMEAIGAWLLTREVRSQIQ